jgi:hypothetical protein
MIFVSNDKKNPKNTSFTTPMKKRWWLVRMSNLMKKKHRIER